MGYPFIENPTAYRVAELILLALAQAAAWWMLYDPNGPMLRPLVMWIKRRNQTEANCIAHMVPELEAFGVRDRSKMVNAFASSYVGVTVHHGIAAILAFLGYYYQNPFLFRFGLSFEIGEDIMHYTQMLVTKFSPPDQGIEPWSYTPKEAWLYVSLHHTIGLLAGSGAFLYTSDWEEVQLYVAVILFCVLPFYLKTPLMLMEGPQTKPTNIGRAALAIDMFSLLVMLFGRFYIAVPLGYDLTLKGYETMGWTGGLFFGSVLMGLGPLFYIASLVMFVPQVIKAFQKQAGGPSPPGAPGSSAQMENQELLSEGEGSAGCE